MTVFSVSLSLDMSNHVADILKQQKKIQIFSKNKTLIYS